MELALNVGLAGALVAGILTLLSPCSVMLLPAFFACAFGAPKRLLGQIGVFFAGLVTTLVPLGILAGTLGGFVTAHREALVFAMAALIIGLGVLQILGIDLPGLSRSGLRDSSALSVYLLGAVYGLAGMCAGPLLGTVLAMAAVGSSPAYGGLLLGVFAVGMVVPLLALSLVWQRVPGVRSMMRPRRINLGPIHTTWTGAMAGALAVAIGITLIATQGLATLGGLLSVKQQFKIEQTAGEWASRVSDPMLLVLALVVGIAWWWWKQRSTRRG